MTEARSIPIPVAGGAVAEDAIDAQAHAVLAQRADEDAVMATVGDGETSSVEGDLPGEGELAGRDGRRLGLEMRRALEERAGRARIGEGAIDEGDKRLGSELAGMHADHATCGIDGDERGPRAHGVRAPDAELAVVERGVDGVEADGRVSDAWRLALGDVLAAVH